MASEANDSPKGILLAFSFFAIVAIVISVLSFDSCVDTSDMKIREACTNVRYSLEPPFSEENVCISSSGELRFSVVNTADFDIRGFNVNYVGKSINNTKIARSLSTTRYVFPIGEYSQESSIYVGISPIIFIEEFNTTSVCRNLQQSLVNIRTCMKD